MKRPLGVTIIAVLLIVSSFLTMFRALSLPGVRMGHRSLVISVLLSILALVAAEALWALRPRAFLMFSIWAIFAMVNLVLFRFFLASSGHGIRLLGPIVYAGLVYAIVALYLRRVV